MADAFEMPIEEDDMPELVEEGAAPAAAATAGPSADPDAFSVPKKSRKRKGRPEDAMEVDATTKRTLAHGKRKKPADDTRRVPVPANRYTPLKQNWMSIFTPIVQNLNLQVRFNLKSRCVEIRRSSASVDVASVQKAVDFVSAFVLGFSAEDAVALLRLDELFVESFEVGDVKPLKGDHLSRAIGRLAGKDGRTKFTIENITKTRIVLADSKVHVLGSFHNIAIARNAICALIMGSPPSKVYGNLRSMASRAMEKF